MISRRMRGDAALRSRVIQREHGVCCTARFERADLLKILALKKQLRSTRFI
jgi:hypothetical protein